MITFNRSCTLCKLHETARTVCVNSRSGPDEVEIGFTKGVILFVGEAPGQDEDTQGRAFVGPAGQLLDQCIEEYNLKPYYISNVVKCRPPGDRKPHVGEVAACLGYLKEEIKALKPKIIVCLGNTPLEALTGKSGVSSYSGTVVKKVGDITIFSLYHPSFILRMPGNLPLFEQHLRELQKVIAGEVGANRKNLDVASVTPRIAREKMADLPGEVFAFDYETTGLHKGADGFVRSIGFSDGKRNFVVNAKHEDTPKFMKWFLDSNIGKAVHNLSFEFRWSVDEYGVEPRNVKYDTRLMQYMVDENASRDLEAMASKYYQAGKWSIDGLMADKGWTYATIPYEYLYPYNGEDAYWTARLVGELGAEMKKQKVMEPYEEIVLPLAVLCHRLERVGIKIDAKFAKEADRDFERRGLGLYRKLSQVQEVQKFLADKLKADKRFLFNPGSSPQIRELLYKRLGFTTTKKTSKGGLLSTDQKVVEKFKGQHPFVDLYLDWKGFETLRSNFTLKFPTYMDKAGLVHPEYDPAGTVTGRPAAKEPPSQTIADDPQVRGMVVSRFKGGKIIVNDLKQLELRLLMNEADDQDVIEMINDGVDLHNITAERVFGRGFTKRDRDIAKTMNFAIGYGIEAASLAFKCNLKYEEAEALIAQFWKGYRKAYVWMQEQHDFVSKNGWIRSRFGRVRHLPELPELLKIPNPPKNLKYRVARLLRQAGNFPIQSQGSDINSLSAIRIDEVLRGREGVKSRVFLPVHDSVMVDSPGSEVRTVAGVCKRVMEGELAAKCPWLKVKLEIDQVISARWGGA